MPRKLLIFNLQVLLAPFEEQFDLPASFINVSNSARGQCKVVSQEYLMDARIGIFVANTTEPDGAIFCPGSCELNVLIAGQTFGFEHRSALNDTVSSVCF